MPWSNNCALCLTEETLQRVFLYCLKVEHFWADLKESFKVAEYQTWETAQYLEFSVSAQPDVK